MNTFWQMTIWLALCAAVYLIAWGLTSDGLIK